MVETTVKSLFTSAEKDAATAEVVAMVGTPGKPGLSKFVLEGPDSGILVPSESGTPLVPLIKLGADNKGIILGNAAGRVVILTDSAKELRHGYPVSDTPTVLTATVLTTENPGQTDITITRAWPRFEMLQEYGVAVKEAGIRWRATIRLAGTGTVLTATHTDAEFANNIRDALTVDHAINGFSKVILQSGWPVPNGLMVDITYTFESPVTMLGSGTVGTDWEEGWSNTGLELSIDHIPSYRNYVDGETYEVGEWLYDPLTKRPFICNTTGIQTETFGENILLWDEVGSNKRALQVYAEDTNYVFGQFIYNPIDRKTYTANTAGAQTGKFDSNILLWDEIAAPSTGEATGTVKTIDFDSLAEEYQPIRGIPENQGWLREINNVTTLLEGSPIALRINDSRFAYSRPLSKDDWINILKVGATVSCEAFIFSSGSGGQGSFFTIGHSAANDPTVNSVAKRQGFWFRASGSSSTAKIEILVDSFGKTLLDGTDSKPTVLVSQWFTLVMKILPSSNGTDYGDVEVTVNGSPVFAGPGAMVSGADSVTVDKFRFRNLNMTNSRVEFLMRNLTLHIPFTDKVATLDDMSADILNIVPPTNTKDYTVIIPDVSDRVGHELNLELNNIGGSFTLKTNGSATSFKGQTELAVPTLVAPVSIHLKDATLVGSQYLANRHMNFGLVSGGNLTATPGTTAFNVGQGIGRFFDVLDPVTPLTKTWSAFTDIPLTETESKHTYILLDITGTTVTVIQIGDMVELSPADRRSFIYLGVVRHGMGTVVGTAINQPQTVPVTGHLIDSYIVNGKAKNFKGHAVTINGTTALAIDVAVGTSYVLGGNFQNDPNNPNFVVNTALVAPTMLMYSGQGHIQGQMLTIIDTGRYDNKGTSVLEIELTAIVSGKFVAHRIWLEPITNLVIFQYGQSQYGTISDLKAKWSNEDLTLPTGLSESAHLLGIFIVALNDTDLTNSDFIPWRD